jgi:hypothetical protein
LVLVEGRADRNTLCDEKAFVNPAACEALNSREQVLLREAVLVAEARAEQMFGEVEADLGGTQPLQHLGGDGDAGTHDPLHDNLRHRTGELRFDNSPS